MSDPIFGYNFHDIHNKHVPIVYGESKNKW